MSGRRFPDLGSSDANAGRGAQSRKPLPGLDGRPTGSSLYFTSPTAIRTQQRYFLGVALAGAIGASDAATAASRLEAIAASLRAGDSEAAIAAYVDAVYPQ